MVKSGDEREITKLLSKYRDPFVTKKHVIEVLDSYQALTFKLDQYVFNDGKTKDLFNLRGTIPIVFKNNSYNIPVCIWVMDTHPQNAPLCYVTPTPDMHIKVSMYIDHNGKVYLPYLHDWQPYSSDLLGLIQVMAVTFGEFPPVFSNPRSNPTPYPPHSFMPQPDTSSSGYMSSYPSAGNAYPPYPTYQNNFPPYPTAGGASSNSAYPPDSGSGYPPYMSSGGGYPHASPSYPPQPPTSTAASTTGTITEEHIKASLISAIEDKLRRRIQEKVNQSHAEMQTLKRTKVELVDGSTKIQDIINKLQREENELKKNISVLEEKDKELEKSLEVLNKVDGIDVDEAVITTAPLYRQLLDAYSDEAATEDAIYYLGEALRAGVIDLEVFLKHVRQLSRKQFMLRALMQRCRQKAGLAG